MLLYWVSFSGSRVLNLKQGMQFSLFSIMNAVCLGTRGR